MNEHELKHIVDQALGYECCCRRGGRCQDVNHTWRRKDGASPHSRLFVARSGESAQGLIALNIPVEREAEFVGEAAKAHVDCRLDCSGSPVFTRYILLPGPNHRAFVETWVKRTVN